MEDVICREHDVAFFFVKQRVYIVYRFYCVFGEECFNPSEKSVFIVNFILGVFINQPN